MSPSTFLLVISSVSLNALAQVFLRQAMLAVGQGPLYRDDVLRFVLSAALNPFLILGMLCYAVSIVVWLAVLSKLEVTVAYPFLSVGYVITALIGFFVLGENVTLMRAAGIALICGGLVFIARNA